MWEKKHGPLLLISVTLMTEPNCTRIKIPLPKGVYINDDMPAELAHRKCKLLPIFKLAKSLDKYKNVTKLRGDRLYINKKLYQVNLSII